MLNKKKVIFCCYGTLGDVLPIIQIALMLKKHNIQSTIITAPHKDFEFPKEIKVRYLFESQENSSFKDIFCEHLNTYQGKKKSYSLIFNNTARFNTPLEKILTEETALGKTNDYLIAYSIYLIKSCLIFSRKKKIKNLCIQCFNFYGPFLKIAHQVLPRQWALKTVKYLFKTDNIDLFEYNKPCLNLFPKNFVNNLYHKKGDIYTGFVKKIQNFDQDSTNTTLDNFLKKHPHPLLITFGTAKGTSRNKDQLFKIAIKSIQSLALPAIIVYKQKTIPIDSDDILYLPFINLQETLKQCRMIIYHGGIGTLSDALHSATPQIIVPSGIDQYDNAAFVTKNRLGLSLENENYTHKNLNIAISRILKDPNFKKRCLAFSQTLLNNQSLDIASECISKMLCE